MDPEDHRSPAEARRLIRQLLEQGEVIFTRHARDEMANDDLNEGDCLNVLRGGIVDPPEIHGTTQAWRYRVHTQMIWVVVAFGSESKLFVISAWRRK